MRQLQKRQLEGREHLVVPVVLIASEMVMHGSSGRVLYPAAETVASTPLWNGKPLVVYHTAGTANAPDAWTRQKVGVLFNAKSCRHGKLTGDAWLDLERVRAVAPEVLQILADGKALEVSTGLGIQAEPSRGIHAGVAYDAIARNYQPDHLAILPDQVGACSVAAGCGLMAG